MEQDKIPHTTLTQLAVRTPCHEAWAQMTGDEKKRFCGVCKKHVFNISAMSNDEALALVNQDAPTCVRFFRRPDGTVMTSECRRGKQRRYALNSIIAAVTTTLLAPFGISTSWSWADDKVPLPEIMGDMVMPPEPTPDNYIPPSPPPSPPPASEQDSHLSNEARQSQERQREKLLDDLLKDSQNANRPPNSAD